MKGGRIYLIMGYKNIYGGDNVKSFSDLERDIKNYKITDYYLEYNSRECYFHYCNNKAFNSILDNSSFWFTHSDYTNDDMEIKEGKKIIINSLNEMYKLYIKEYMELLVYRVFDIIKHCYILSFCKSDNSSNMWREYAGLDGYCIKINVFDMLNFKLQGNIRGKEIGKYFYVYNGLVLYDDKLKVDKVKKLLLTFGEIYKLWLKRSISEEKFKELELYVINGLAEFCLFCKNSGWESEKEYRIVLVPKSSEANIFLESRTSEYFEKVPYFDVSFRGFKDLIQGAVLGPQNNNCVEEIKLKLKNYNYKYWDVKKIDLPIRF